MAGFVAGDELVDTENGYDVINSVNKIIDVIVSGYSQAGFVMTPTLGSRYVDTTNATNAIYKMYSGTAWMPIFEIDTTTNKVKVSSGVDVSASAPVQSVNNKTGIVEVNQLFPPTTGGTAMVRTYDTATTAPYSGTLIEVVKTTGATNLNALPAGVGQLAYDTASNRFLGRYAGTGWGPLTGSQSVASEVNTLSATGFTAANKIVMSNAANSGVVIESDYTIPKAIVGTAGKVLMSDGTNVSFKPIQNIYVTLSGANPPIDWSVGHLFFHTTAVDVTYSFAGTPVNGQMMMLMVKNTDSTNGHLITLPSARWIMGVPIKEIAPNSTTIYTIMMANTEYWVVSTRDFL